MIKYFQSIDSQRIEIEPHRWTQLISNGKKYQLKKRYVFYDFEKGKWEESDDMKEWTICEEVI